MQAKRRVFTHWALAILAAAAMQRGLDFFLPLDTSRLVLITLGGLAGIIWSELIDDPLKRWASR